MLILDADEVIFMLLDADQEACEVISYWTFVYGCFHLDAIE